MSGWISLISGLIRLANGLTEWLSRRRDFEAGETAALKAAYEEGLKNVRKAKAVDQYLADPDNRTDDDPFVQYLEQQYRGSARKQ